MTSNKMSFLHLVTPSSIDLRGNFALAESVGQIHCRFDHQSHEYDLVAFCRFISRMEKVVDSWKMLSFEAIYIRDSIAVPVNAPALEFGCVKDWPRSSYRFLAWHLMQSGVEPRQDLPGEDDEGSVQKIRTRNQDWLGSLGALSK